jgi:hypothetical protein
MTSTASIADTRVWTGIPEPDLTDWLGSAPHTLDGDQLVLHTPDGDIRPRAGSTLVQWTDSTVTSASPRTAQRVYGPDGLNGRLQRTEAAITRVRRAVHDFPRGEHPLRAGKTLAGQLAARVLAALDGETDPHHAAPERCETGNARKDHPVHELLAALKAGVPHPDPRGLISRYYQAIHQECCPYDHTEPRPGHAAAANRAALDEPKEH